MMQAMVYTQYGPPDVLHLQEVEKPVPGKGEVLVQVHAASLNFGDLALVRGRPFIARLWSGLRAPKFPILGTDIAGQIVAVGDDVQGLRPGDAIFGDIGAAGFGAFAEYVCVPAHTLTSKPVTLTFEEAAAVPQAAIVALQGLRDEGGIQPGQAVLINGASGGIGTFAVQLAKAYGAEVTGVCGSRNLDLVRSIGADDVMDYTCEDYTQNGQCYDLIFDIVANHSLQDALQALKPEGCYVACAFNPTSLFLGPLISRSGGKRACSLRHQPNQEDLVVMKGLLEQGAVVPVIDRRYPLPELAVAMQYLATSHHHGKVVITHV